MTVRHHLFHLVPVRWQALTKASVAGQLLVDLLHALDVEATGLGMVHHGLGVVHTNNALGRLLHALWRVPWVIDVFGGEASQDGQVASGGERGRDVQRGVSEQRRLLEEGSAYRM